MRNLAAGNKKLFSGFIIVIILIILLLIVTLSIALQTERKTYTINAGACLYDENYEFIELESDGTITKKWNGKYYLVQTGNDTQYSLGSQVVVYEASQNRLNVYGNSYQVFQDAKVEKIEEENEINNLTEDKFYKLDDRKYLIVGGSIKNETGTISTKRYLIIEIDKSGNTLLFNYEMETKTINPMVIQTNSFRFDIANEKLIFEEEEIDLKKIIGSTNEYEEKRREENEVEGENEVVEGMQPENQTQNNISIGSASQEETTTTTIINNEKVTNNDRTVVNDKTTNNNGSTTSNSENNSSNNDNNNNNTDNDSSDENSNNSGQDSNNTNRTPLVKSVSLRALNAKSSYIDVEYAIVDPENLYRTVYIILKGNKEKTIALDKEKTSYRITDLTPNTTYKITLGYKEILSDNTTQDVTEDVMIVRTTKVQNSLNITKITKKNITFNLKLDSNYAYDSANLVLYVDGIRGEELAVDVDKATTSSGWTQTISYDAGREIILKLEDAIYNGNEVETTLQATTIME